MSRHSCSACSAAEFLTTAGRIPHASSASADKTSDHNRSRMFIPRIISGSRPIRARRVFKEFVGIARSEFSFYAAR
jgi:hypothetical protein